jgi:hypothetical protein
MRRRFRLIFFPAMAAVLVSLGTLSVGLSATPAAATSSSGPFTPLSPTRLLDTRNGTGAPQAPVAAGGTVVLTVDGVGGVPATGVSAVVLNVTVTQPTAQGHITVYPDGTTLPTASNLNFVAGESVPNSVIAPVGADGKIDFNNGSGGTVQLLADVSGYFSGGGTAANGTFTPVPPSRLLDTRNGTGAPDAPVAAGGTVVLTVEGVGGVPATGISAVVLNVTVTQPSAQGHITVYPDGTTLPTASNLNFHPGETVPNAVIAPVGADGKIDFNNGSGGTVQLLADVSGYFTGTPPNPLSSSAIGSQAVTPLVSTPAPVASNSSLALQIDGIGGVPASGVAAVVMNVTVTQPSAQGHITVYPDGTTLPTTSSLNFVAGETVPNLVIAPVGTDGKVAFFNGSGGTVQLIADVSGYFLGSGTYTGSLQPLAPVRFLDTRNGTGEGSNTAPPTPGAISGTVTDTSSSPVAGATVDVFSGSVNKGSVTTATDGTYQVGNLAPGTYHVCFDASTVTSTAPPGGYADQCYNAVAWDGNGADISGATGVAVTAASDTPGINAELAGSGGVSGTVTNTSHSGLAGVKAEIFSSAGNYLTESTTAADGTYQVNGLTAGSYDVCFDGSAANSADQCYNGVDWNGLASDVGGSTPVTVTAGSVTGSIDATLATGGGVSGTVTDSHSDPLTNVHVEVFSTSDQEVGFAATASDGTYNVSGLANGSDHVCFDASAATGGTSTTGYPSQCYSGVAWDGNAADSGSATAMTITAGVTKTGINATLAAGGAISGRVTDSSSNGLANVAVDVDSTASGGYLATATTDSNGDYTVTGLPAGTQTVCFDASSATGGSSTGGYLDQCYQGVAWNGTENEVQAGATAITVAASATKSGINATLASSGEITGTVTDTSSDPLSFVDVEVLTPTGGFVGDAFTDSTGAYTVTGVAAGTYDVCFLANFVSGGSSTSGYEDQCYDNVSWDGSPTHLSGATPVTVTAGSTQSGVDDALAAAPTASITGTVTDSTADPLSDVDVEVLTSGGSFAGSSFTAPDGTYTVTGLPTGSYDVCFSGQFASGGSSTTGYSSQCYKNVSWNGSIPPSGATPVAVTAGSTTPNINAALANAGGISGTVDDASSNPLESVDVEVFNGSGNYVTSSSTGLDGTYAVPGLSAGTYDVCFFVSSFAEPTGGSSTTGYLDQCYNNVSWNGSNPIPTAAKAVAVTTGSTTPNINAALASAGAITGTVDDTHSNGLNDVEVEVFGSGGTETATAFTQSGGSYSVIGLPTGTYDVCFAPFGATGGSSTTGYLAQCYKNVSWGGSTVTIPTGATSVPVTAGSTHSGVDAALVAAGGISGTVDDSSSHPLQGVEVFAVPTGGTSAGGETSTSASGTYALTGLTPGTYNVCFAALPTSEPTGGSSTSGYLDQCYNNVSWGGSTFAVPSGATPVTVTSGNTGGINAALATAGSISGTVDDSSSHPLDGVDVYVYNAGAQVFATITGSTGTYSVLGLAAGTYDVCFLAPTSFEPTGGSSTTGYLDQCYNDVSWNGSIYSTLPSGATPVTVTTGNKGGINAALATAGGISGTVDDASSHPLQGVDVEVYSPTGALVESAGTGSNGAYSVVGLNTGTYDVCFATSTFNEPTGGTSVTGYLDQCYKNVAWNGTITDISGSTPVQVTAGSNTGSVNAALATAGAILGTVDDASSHPLDGVFVGVYTTSGSLVGSAGTGSNGTYSIIGLATGSYQVCFSVIYGQPTGGSSTTGYLPQCYKNVAWNGGSIPPSATAVPVTAGSTTSNINGALAAAGAVSGTVDDASSHPLTGVGVYLFTSSGAEVGFTTTGSNGTYSIIGLPTASYDVCFYASSANEPTGGSSTTGYLDQCYKNVSWIGPNFTGLGTTSLPTGVTTVQVTAGSTTSNINGALAAAGAVSGTVDDASSHPLGGVFVYVYTASGSLVGFTTGTQSNGTYSVLGLPTGTYNVCFNASAYAEVTGGSSTTGYGSQCYNNMIWDGVSKISGASAVSVTAGSTTTGISAALPNGGVIAGTVDDSSSHPLRYVEVEVINSSTGSLVGSASTASDGTYSISGLSAGTYDVCFDTNYLYYYGSPVTGGTSTTGYGNQCYNGVAWDGAVADISGASTVHVTAGATTSGVNAALPNGGVISGTVDDSSSHPLTEAGVEVLTTGGTVVSYGLTNSNGTYSISGLSAGTYEVCFYGYFASGSSTTGYGSQCYNGVSWNGYSKVTGATAVHVTAGATTSGINGTLPNGGVIAGTVNDSSSHPLANVLVEVATAAGVEVGLGVTTSNGSYTVSGLSPGTYDVCFLATDATGGTSSTGYLDQCYKNVSWNGSLTNISGATGVSVTAGATTSNINAALASA